MTEKKKAWEIDEEAGSSELKQEAELSSRQANAGLLKGMELGALLTGVVKEDRLEPFLVIPDGFHMEVPDSEELVQPSRHRGTVDVKDLPSFCVLVRKHGDEPPGAGRENNATEVFVEGHVFTAVFNSHSRQEPGHGDLRAVMHLEYSKEWLAWKAAIGKAGLTQVGLAELIEDYIHTIAEPDAAELAGTVKSLKVTKKVNFVSEMDLFNGSARLEYVNEVAEGQVGGKKTIDIPTELKLVLPIFKNGDKHEVVLRVRWRLDEDHHCVVFGFAIKGEDKLEDDIVAKVSARIKKETGFVVLNGSPWTDVGAESPNS